MDDYENDHDWEEQNNEPNDGLVWDEYFWKDLFLSRESDPGDGLNWDKRFWQDLFLYQESALGDEVFFEQEIEEDEEVLVEEKYDNDWEESSERISKDLDDYLTYIITGGPEGIKLRNEWIEEERLLEEEASHKKTFWQDVLAGHENEPPPKDFNEKVYRFFREVAGVIYGIIVLILILFAFRAFLEGIGLLFPTKPTQSVTYERSISDDYSDSNGESGWGCPDGCTYHKEGCDIKGNKSFNTGEKIYHVPGQTFYADTVISPDYGERWFCTEEEARDNGWRKSSN